MKRLTSWLDSTAEYEIVSPGYDFIFSTFVAIVVFGFGGGHATHLTPVDDVMLCNCHGNRVCSSSASILNTSECTKLGAANWAKSILS